MIIRRIGLILLALVMASVGLSAWVGLQRTASVAPEFAFATATAWQPWGGPAWIPSARQLLASQADSGQRAQILRRLSRQYPLTAYLWLEKAQVALAQREPVDAIRQLLAVAVEVEPGNPDILWRAAMTALQADDRQTAWHYLRRYIGFRPHEIDRAILIARRWLEDRQTLLDAIVADNRQALRFLLPHAANWGDWELAAQTWRRLPDSIATEPQFVNVYLERLLHAGYGEQAAQIWRRVKPDYVSGAIPNGNFAGTLLQRSALEWRFRHQAGVSIDRDLTEYVSPPASLQLKFDGTENLRLAGPHLYFVVEPGRTYRLSGQWRAQGLTTLALPYWSMIGHINQDHIDESNRSRLTLARIESAGRGDWPWQAFSVVFEAPEHVEVIQLQLLRESTRNFDRLLAGDLWLDDIAIEQVISADVDER